MTAEQPLPALLSVERTVLRVLSRDARRRSLRLARRRALVRFASRYPQWSSSLFDPHLLESLPDDYFRRDARAIARSWTLQFPQEFPYRDEASRDRDIRSLQPVAQAFLDMLDEEESRLAL